MGLSNYLPSSRIAQSGVCTSSTRPASPYEGQVIYETDTDRVLVWNASAWVAPNSQTANPPGLELITTGTLSSSITNFPDCFTTSYRNYRVVIDDVGLSAAGDIYIQYLTSGTTAVSGSNYYWSYRGITGGGASQDSNANAASGGYLGWTTGGTGGQGGVVFDVSNPQRAAVTLTTGSSFYLGSGTYGSRQGSVAWDGTQQFTGFRINTITGPTITRGNVLVYGYRN